MSIGAVGALEAVRAAWAATLDPEEQVGVYIGTPLTWDLARHGIFVGSNSTDARSSGVTTTWRDPRGTGIAGAGVRHLVHCYVSINDGGGTQESTLAAAAAAQDLVDRLHAALTADPRLGGTVMSARIEEAQRVQVFADEDGSTAVIDIDVAVTEVARG